MLTLLTDIGHIKVFVLVTYGCNFQVQFPDSLGDIYKVRIGFAGDTKRDENWLLDSVCAQHKF